MSTQALTVYESLLASGIPEEKARAAAEAIDRDCTDKITASEEKAAAQFVAKGEYSHRMEKTPDRAEAETQYARLRDEIRDVRDEIKDVRGEIKDLRVEIKELRSEVHLRLDALYRILIGILVGVVGIFAAVAAFAVKFIFFGF